jgi:hypothetical protein
MQRIARTCRRRNAELERRYVPRSQPGLTPHSPPALIRALPAVTVLVARSKTSGRVAQLVEQGIENPRVGGSIPSPATTFPCNSLQLAHQPTAIRCCQLAGFANMTTQELHTNLCTFPGSRSGLRAGRRSRPRARNGFADFDLNCARNKSHSSHADSRVHDFVHEFDQVSFRTRAK